MKLFEWNNFWILVPVLSLLLLPSACSSDDDSTETEINDPVQGNIANLNISLESPEPDRDFSYFDSGSFGVFENPEDSKEFTGKVTVSYIDPSSPAPNSDIQLTWRSSF